MMQGQEPAWFGAAMDSPNKRLCRRLHKRVYRVLVVRVVPEVFGDGLGRGFVVCDSAAI